MSNLFPTVKAMVDGLTDSGVLKDDSDRYVTSLEMMRGDGLVKGGQMVLEIFDAGDGV